MLLSCMAGLCPNIGVLLEDKGLQLLPSLGGRFGFPSISCTSDTLDQGARPCQGEDIWGSLSCRRWSQGFAGSQGSGTDAPCHTEMPTATKRHQQQMPSVFTHSGLGQGNDGLPVLLELGLVPTAEKWAGQPCAAFPGACQLGLWMWAAGGVS